MDMNAPLLMSDFHLIDPLIDTDNTLMTKDFTEPPSMDEGDAVDQMAGVFNGLWRAHRTTASYRCTQRHICQTLTANNNIIHQPLVQTTT